MKNHEKRMCMISLRADKICSLTKDNHNEFIKNNYNKTLFLSFKKNYIKFRLMINPELKTKEGINHIIWQFHHEFNTLLSNLRHHSFISYGWLCSTEYQNNSEPNLYEINLRFSHYEFLGFKE